MTDKQLPPLPTLLHTRVVDGIPCISVSEHEYQMREYALQIIANAAQPSEVTDEFLYELWDEKFRSWIGGEQFESIARAILALRPVQVPMTEGTARQFVEWMKAQPDDREPTTIDGALAEFEAHHGITAQAKKEAL